MPDVEKIIEAAKAAGAKKITIIGDRVEIDFEPSFTPNPGEYVPVWPWPYTPTPVSPPFEPYPSVPTPYVPYWEITC